MDWLNELDLDLALYNVHNDILGDWYRDPWDWPELNWVVQQRPELMELFYKAFFLTRQFLKADARIPKPAALPDAEDRFIANELENRREFALRDVLEGLRVMSQTDLLEIAGLTTVHPAKELSETDGLREAKSDAEVDEDYVSITPEAQAIEL
jgi:hypothetical protein